MPISHFQIFCEGVMMTCSIIAAIVGILNRKKFRFLKYLYFYPLASLLLMFSHYLIGFKPYDDYLQNKIANCGTNIFLLIEFLILYAIFLTGLHNKIKKILLTVGGSYLLYILYSWYSKQTLNYYPEDLVILQAIVILIPNFYLLIEYVKTDKLFKWQEDPKFWIIIGALIYFGCTLPLFFLLSLTKNSDGTISSHVFLINNIFYSILFLSIAKAYLCPPPGPISIGSNTIVTQS